MVNSGNTYKLVNPYIKGEFNRNIKADNSMKAAKNFYENLSEHFNNSIPKFYFTVQKGGGTKGKFYHFEVKEKKNKSEVSYSIRPFDVEGKSTIDSFVENFKSFKSRYNKNNSTTQKGGAKRKKSRKSSRRKSRRKSRSDDDDDYGDDLDLYRNEYSYVPSVSQPLYYMYYDPHVYNIDSYFLPTFYAYATPVIELNSFGYTISK